MAAESHECPICNRVRGNGEFAVGDNVAYVTPALISHYVTVHRCNPPAEFIDAVLACPSFSSDAYGLLLRHILCIQHIDRSSRMPLEDQETREQAVSFLRERGFHAFIRDWTMGQTIGVASHPLRHHEIEGWERMVYVAA